MVSFELDKSKETGGIDVRLDDEDEDSEFSELEVEDGQDFSDIE